MERSFATQIPLIIGGKEFSDKESALSSIITPDNFTLAQRQEIINDVRNAVDAIFAGKTPVPTEKTPIMLSTHGAPGSGKSHHLYETYQSMTHSGESYVYLSHDENGIIESLKAYQRQINNFSPDTTHEEKLAVRNNVRHATQIGYSIALHRALIHRFNIMNDVTNSGPGALFGLAQARQLGYHNMVASYYADYELCKKRAMSRPRAIDINEELIGKRIGAFNMFDPILQNIRDHDGSMALYDTSLNNERKCIFLIEKGSLTYFDHASYNRLQTKTENDYMKHSDGDFSSVSGPMQRAIDEYAYGLQDVLISYSQTPDLEHHI